MFRLLSLTLQFILIAAIFGFLFWSAVNATDEEGKNIFNILLEQPKRWHCLAAAFFTQLAGVCMTFVRWRWLLQTLGLQCSYRDVFRLGFLGAMLNLAPFGIVGGDTVKAVLIAQKNPNSMHQAVASVFVDRFIGLLIMFLCGTILILYTGFYARPEIIAQTLTLLVFTFTASGLFLSGCIFLPFFARGHCERWIGKIPIGGKFASKFVQALLLYRNDKRCLRNCALLTMFVHLSFGMSLYWIASALFVPVPDAVQHIMLHNVTNLTSMLPLAAGPYELVLEQLYQLYGMSIGMGLIVSLMFRLTSIGVAASGIFYYYVWRSVEKVGGSRDSLT